MKITHRIFIEEKIVTKHPSDNSEFLTQSYNNHDLSSELKSKTNKVFEGMDVVAKKNGYKDPPLYRSYGFGNEGENLTFEFYASYQR